MSCKWFFQILFGLCGDLGTAFLELTKLGRGDLVDMQTCTDGYGMTAGDAELFGQWLCHKMVFMSCYRVDPAVTADHLVVSERGTWNGEHDRTDVRTCSSA